MKRFRTFGFALWLALALLVGQQAAALHDLGHAAAKLAQEKSAPAGTSTCDKHFLYAQFAGSVGASKSVPVVACAGIAPASLVQEFPPAQARLAFRSRAPPALL